MESQHRAILATIATLVDAETMARRDRAELIEACRTLAGWLRQYVEIAAEQGAEIERLNLELGHSGEPPQNDIARPHAPR